MPRGSAIPPSSPGRGRGQVVRPPTPDVSDASGASTQLIVPPSAPLSIPTTSENPSMDSMQFTTSSAAPPPTAVPRACMYISSDDIQHDRAFHSCIGKVVSSHYTHPWSSYKDIPDPQKNFWFEELKRIYRWDCSDKEVRRSFEKCAGKWLSKKFNEARTTNKQSIWIANDVWASLLEYWGTNEFKKKSTQNKANRLANPTIANTIYRGGSSSMGEHKRKLAQLGRPPQQMKVFASCYKKKDDDSWSGSRAEEVAETYQKMLEECPSQLTPSEEGGSSAASVTPLEEEQFWTEAAGGRKRSRVFGMGSEALTSNVARPWTKDHRASTSNAASAPKPPVSTQLQEIKLMLDIHFDKMGIQMLRPDQPSATDAPAEESMQQQDKKAADP
ncbi:UNVERIFIED_CONTAM: hypothetical protein Scaly_1007500 [Sesamum calycinum]|uniref:Transposase, Ptta/En/Spm, plant n=1 Tax=Sesamum calycinum TaxID=2727403 RepID=A0AAW2QJR8_9LAMI